MRFSLNANIALFVGVRSELQEEFKRTHNDPLQPYVAAPGHCDENGPILAHALSEKATLVVNVTFY